MQELKITSPGPDGHTHIVYLNSETGASAMSPSKDGHVHDVIFQPAVDPTPAQEEVPPQIDPATGQPMIDPQTGMPDQGQPAVPANPGQPAMWIVRPAPMGAQNSSQALQIFEQNQNGSNLAPLPMQAMEGLHDHTLEDYVPDIKQKKEPQSEVLEECLALWREGVELVQDCVKKGKEAEDFYAGKQWEDGLMRWLQTLDRAALTINEIAPNIDTLLGYQMEQRTDIRYLPQEGGDQRVADALNVIVKRVLDNCYYQREETKVFKDQVVPGFGAFNVYMNFKKNIQGEIQVERFPWDSIVYGPHEKEDLEDCEYEVRSRMQSLATLKMMFPKKAKDIETCYSHYTGQYPNLDSRENNVDGTHTDYQYAKKVDDVPVMLNGSIPLVDVQKKQFRLAQCTRKMYKEVTVIFNVDEQYFYTAQDWEDEDIAKASTIPGFQVVSQMKPRMRITKFVGNLVLSDENPAELPVNDFYTVPVYAYRQNGEFWGKVEAAKDPQRELNKRRSQAMDTVNRLGAAVYYVEPDTFATPKEEEDFKKKRSRPGSIFKVNDVGRKPVLEEGADLPPTLVTIMQMDQQNLQRLMNVVTEQGGANESGSLFLEKKKGRLTGNQFLFDNLSFAKQRLGKILAGLVQKYYPTERKIRILNAQYSKQKFKLAGQDYSDFTPSELEEMFNNADLLEYDVIVTDSAFSASTRIGIAKVLFDLIQQGAPIPPELALEFVDMPSDVRARISEQLAAQTEQATEQATNSSNTEIIKTLIAKGAYTVTPEKASELGLVPATDPTNPLANQVQTPNNGGEQQISQADIYASNLASGLAG